MLQAGYIVRNMRAEEFPLLEEFLYQAIYVPEGFEGEIPRNVIYDDPKCRAAFEGFGALPDDRALVAEHDGKVVAACWVRTTDEYGHIDDATPSFSISAYREHRGKGVGTALMNRMLDELFEEGYACTSLSVQKENPAVRLYLRLGFHIVGNGADDSEWLMVCPLNEPFISIETERLILRPWLASDAESLYTLACDPEVGPRAGWPAHANMEESALILATVLAAPDNYAVVLRETGEVIGCVGFNEGNAANMPLAKDELELGYWIGKPYWGHGYATEAARALIKRGFDELELSCIRAAYYDGNDQSGRVLEKLGFRYERTEDDVDCPLIGERRTEHFVYLPG